MKQIYHSISPLMHLNNGNNHQNRSRKVTASVSFYE